MKASIGTTWDRTVDFVRERYRAIAPAALVTLFLPTVVTVSLEGWQQVATGATAGVLVAVTIALSLVSYWGQLFVTGLAVEPDVPAGPRATRRFLPLIGVTLLLGLGLVVLMIPAIVLVATSGIDFANFDPATPPPPEAVASLGFAGLYALVISPLLLWLAARLLLVTPVVLMERRGVGAIARGFALTRGMALKLVGLILLYLVVSVVAVSAVRFVFGSIFALVAGGDGPVTVGGVLTGIAVAAISTVLSVLFAAFLGKLYVAVAHVPDDASVFE